MRCQASSYFPSPTNPIKPAISTPAGQAALQGGVLSSYLGLIYLHVPVLFQLISPEEIGKKGISDSRLYMILPAMMPPQYYTGNPLKFTTITAILRLSILLINPRTVIRLSPQDLDQGNLDESGDG